MHTKTFCSTPIDPGRLCTGLQSLSGLIGVLQTVCICMKLLTLMFKRSLGLLAMQADCVVHLYNDSHTTTKLRMWLYYIQSSFFIAHSTHTLIVLIIDDVYTLQ